MNEKIIISIDIGTTSTKATLFNLEGFSRGSFYQNYPLTTTAAGQATQDPDIIFQAVLATLQQGVAACKSTLTDAIAITFSSAMHSLLCLDEQNIPLTPLITYADSRSTAQIDKLKGSSLARNFYQRTGTPLHPMSPLAKILWLKTEEKTLFEKTVLFSSIKEYVFFKLFGEHIVDFSIASGTGFFNIHDANWDQEILEFLTISEQQLPKICPPTTQLRNLLPGYQEFLGLSSDIPFIIGASDGALANLGTNCLTAERMNLTIGTSAGLRLTVDQPLLHSKGKSFCYLLSEGYWVVGGASNNGGLIVEWAKNNLADSGISHSDFFKKISTIPPGAEGLFFHPYLTGERAPLWQGDLRGSFSGLGLHHSREHLTRAVLEGVCYNVADIFTSLKDLALQPTEIIASGGFSQSAMWQQLTADILGHDLLFPTTYESSGLGAMIIALQSLGLIANLKESSQLAVFKQTNSLEEIMADTALKALYQEKLRLYQQLKPLVEQQRDLLK